MTQQLGADQAKAVADEHENAGDRQGQSPAERAMDEANNAAGRKCAAQNDPTKTNNCYDNCMNLLLNGGLSGLGGVPLIYTPR